MNAINTFIFKLVRGLLAAWCGVLVQKGYLTDGNVADVALVIATGLGVLISQIVSAVMHKLKVETAADAPAGTDVKEIKAAAWEVFLQRIGIGKDTK
jgi:hypothetical protein